MDLRNSPEKQLTARFDLVIINTIMSRRNKTSQPLTTALQQAIRDSKMGFRELERETGVIRQSLMKFMRNEQSLRLDIADKLAAYFALELKSTRQRKGK